MQASGIVFWGVRMWFLVACIDVKLMHELISASTLKNDCSSQSKEKLIVIFCLEFWRSMNSNLSIYYKSYFSQQNVLAEACVHKNLGDDYEKSPIFQ